MGKAKSKNSAPKRATRSSLGRDDKSKKMMQMCEEVADWMYERFEESGEAFTFIEHGHTLRGLDSVLFQGMYLLDTDSKELVESIRKTFTFEELFALAANGHESLNYLNKHPSGYNPMIGEVDAKEFIIDGQCIIEGMKAVVGDCARAACISNNYKSILKHKKFGIKWLSLGLIGGLLINCDESNRLPLVCNAHNLFIFYVAHKVFPKELIDKIDGFIRDNYSTEREIVFDVDRHATFMDLLTEVHGEESANLLFAYLRRFNSHGYREANFGNLYKLSLNLKKYLNSILPCENTGFYKLINLCKNKVEALEALNGVEDKEIMICSLMMLQSIRNYKYFKMFPSRALIGVNYLYVNVYNHDNHATGKINTNDHKYNEAIPYRVYASALESSLYDEFKAYKTEIDSFYRGIVTIEAYKMYSDSQKEKREKIDVNTRYEQTKEKLNSSRALAKDMRAKVVDLEKQLREKNRETSKLSKLIESGITFEDVENLKLELTRANEELSTVKEDNSNISRKLSKTDKIIEDLNEDVELKKLRIDELEEKVKWLSEFNASKVDEDVSTEAYVNAIKKYNIVLVGGDMVHSRLVELGLDNIRTFKASDHSLQFTDVNDADLVVLFTSYVAHSSIAKAVNSCRTHGIPMLAFNNRNVDSLISQIFNKIYS